MFDNQFEQPLCFKDFFMKLLRLSFILKYAIIPGPLWPKVVMPERVSTLDEIVSMKGQTGLFGHAR